MKIYKVCEYCHGINRIQSDRCTKCGRFKNNLILGEYSPRIDYTLTDEDLKLAQENFIPKRKYPQYKENIVPSNEIYPITNIHKDNLILNIYDTAPPPVHYVRKYDTKAKLNRQQALEQIYSMISHQNRQESQDIFDIIEKIFNWLFNLLKSNLLFRYISIIVIITVFLIWFLGGLFSQIY
ncbi:MAG: hypothetical protein ACI4WH_03920 [Oscillospiraceae bacterium]